MRVFVTGVAGFLGSHVADAMLADGHHVVGIDNMIGGDLENVDSRVEFHQLDCGSFDAVRALSRNCEIVYHCAAAAYEGLSIFSPHFIAQNIVAASTSVFSAAIANGAKRIVFCSSMARYGALTPPFTEELTPRPQDPYGIAKLAAEELLRNLCEVHETEFVIAVPHNIIGPRQKYDDPFRNVASIMINLKKCRSDITHDGLRHAASVHTGDGARRSGCFSRLSTTGHLLPASRWRAICRTAFRSEPGHQGIAEAGGTRGSHHLISISDGRSADRKAACGSRLVTRRSDLPERPQEVAHALCSSSKARALLNYRTAVSLDDGLTRMIDFIDRRGRCGRFEGKYVTISIPTRRS